MTTPLPSPRDAAHLARLRSLRVRRAREACDAARATLEAASAAVARRERAIAELHGQRAALERAVLHELASRMARWCATVGARREWLADRLEREEYALSGEQATLEEARAALTEAREAFARALAREDVVNELVGDVRRAVSQRRDARIDRELEDMGRRERAVRA